MHKNTIFFMAVAATAVSSAQAQQAHLVVHVDPEESTVFVGDTVHYHIWAELLNPTETVLAVVSNISFDFGFDWFATTPLVIFDNSFEPAFDSDFFGPAIDGVVAGSTIIGARGTNTLPPLNNAGGIDSSNPLEIYSFSVDTSASTQNVYFPTLNINSQFDGAYTGSPYPDVFFYQFSDGSPGSMPFSILANPLFVSVPAPATGMLGLLGLAAIRRRRSR